MEHNIFISYAWVDNEVYPGAEQGWVSTFVDGLRKHLAHELGRKDEADRVWLDYEQMRGNQGLTPTIAAQLAASRTLVLFLSRGYLVSPWCRQELAAYVDRVGTDSGRIFVVRMSAVEQEPEHLRDLLKYDFTYLDENKRPCTRWFPYIDPTDRDYASTQQMLARDLAAKLRELRQAPDEAPTEPQSQPELHPEFEPELQRDSHPGSATYPSAIDLTTPLYPREPLSEADRTRSGREQPKRTGKGGARRQAPAETPTARREPRADRTASAGGDRFVLVDGGIEDRDLIREIAQQLQHHDIGVALPLSALGDQSGAKSSALTRDLRTKLGLCDSVLMVYCRGPAEQVSQHLIECMKACTKAPKGKAPPTMDLCQTQRDPLALGLHPRGMRIHVVDEACAGECVEWFLGGTD